MHGVVISLPVDRHTTLAMTILILSLRAVLNARRGNLFASRSPHCVRDDNLYYVRDDNLLLDGHEAESLSP